MPDHTHLLAEGEDPDEARRTLATALSRATYRKGERLWLPVPDPEVVREHRLRIVVRYVVLNPCRKSLVDDPVLWPWSTYRDVLGAAVDPWVDAERLARCLGECEAGFVPRFHRYVTLDNRVAEEARALPAPARPTPTPTHSLDEIALATAASLRCPFEAIQRRGKPRQLFLALARCQGWTDSRVLAEACGVTPRAIRKPSEAPAPSHVRAGLVCLGSRRWTRNFES